MLNLGDIIQAEAIGDGKHRLLKVTRADGWAWGAQGLERQATDHPEVKPLLDRLVKVGGGWECMAGHLTLQFPKEGSASEPPEEFPEVWRQLKEVIEGNGLLSRRS